MNTWTPLWSKIVDSSLWMEDLHVRVLFTTMMALKDRDHVVRFSSFGLSRRANMSEELVLDGLRVLLSPDTKRSEPQEHEGRRIEKVEGGWKVLNGEVYRQMMQLEWRREYQRVKQAEYRSKDPSKKKQKQWLGSPRTLEEKLAEGHPREPFSPVMANDVQAFVYQYCEANKSPVQEPLDEGGDVL